MSRDTRRPIYNIRDLEEEYLSTDDTIWCQDETINAIKHNIKDRLNDTEKRLLLLYAEIGSQRKVAELLRVSPATINRIIKDIREKLNKEERDIETND